MSELPGRLYRLALSHLDAAKQRLSEIDGKAQEELDNALAGLERARTSGMESDDPMQRAAAKIAAARNAAKTTTPPAAATPVANQPARTVTPYQDPVNEANPIDPSATAYRILGLPQGSDFTTVNDAVTKYRDRIAVTRFAEGSPERAEAQKILDRVEHAYTILRAKLDPTDGRFDKLEF